MQAGKPSSSPYYTSNHPRETAHILESGLQAMWGFGSPDEVSKRLRALHGHAPHDASRMVSTLEAVASRYGDAAVARLNPMLETLRQELHLPGSAPRRSCGSALEVLRDTYKVTKGQDDEFRDVRNVSKLHQLAEELKVMARFSGQAGNGADMQEATRALSYKPARPLLLPQPVSLQLAAPRA